MVKKTAVVAAAVIMPTLWTAARVAGVQAGRTFSVSAGRSCRQNRPKTDVVLRVVVVLSETSSQHKKVEISQELDVQPFTECTTLVYINAIKIKTCVCRQP